MITSYVHEEGLFTSPETQKDWRFVLMHLEDIRRNGILPRPKEQPAFFEAVKDFKSCVPPEKKQYFCALLSDLISKRSPIVEVKESDSERIEACFCSRDALTRCLSLSNAADPDFTLLSDVGFTRWKDAQNGSLAIKSDCCGCHVTQFTEFVPEPCPFEKDLFQEGTEDFNNNGEEFKNNVEGFKNNVLHPIFKWAENVWLIDRYVGESFMQKQCVPKDRGGRNWPKFKTTIQMILEEWRRARRREYNNGRFHVITGAWNKGVTSERDKDYWEQVLHTTLTERNKGRSEDVVVHMRNYSCEIGNAKEPYSRIDHSRYLHTKFCTLRLESGFDIIYTHHQKKIPKSSIISLCSSAGVSLAQEVIRKVETDGEEAYSQQKRPQSCTSSGNPAQSSLRPASESSHDKSSVSVRRTPCRLR